MSIEKPNILVAIGNGSEEIETACAVDTFIRAGATVTLASVESSKSVKMSRGMTYVADKLISDVNACDMDCIALPGGMPGAQRLSDNSNLVSALRAVEEKNGVIAAVCASPAVVLAKHGFLDGKKATCYPVEPFQKEIVKKGDGPVVVDGKIVTGTGPGTALIWALMVVEVLVGKEKADQLASEMLVEREKVSA